MHTVENPNLFNVPQLAQVQLLFFRESRLTLSSALLIFYSLPDEKRTASVFRRNGAELEYGRPASLGLPMHFASPTVWIINLRPLVYFLTVKIQN
jgi:hypothetical protein